MQRNGENSIDYPWRCFVVNAYIHLSYVNINKSYFFRPALWKIEITFLSPSYIDTFTADSGVSFQLIDNLLKKCSYLHPNKMSKPTSVLSNLSLHSDDKSDQVTQTIPLINPPPPPPYSSKHVIIDSEKSCLIKVYKSSIYPPLSAVNKVTISQLSLCVSAPKMESSNNQSTICSENQTKRNWDLQSEFPLTEINKHTNKILNDSSLFLFRTGSEQQNKREVYTPNETIEVQHKKCVTTEMENACYLSNCLDEPKSFSQSTDVSIDTMPGPQMRTNLGNCSKCCLRINNIANACQAMGCIYHNDCFICCCCQRTLRGKIFYKDQNMFYCEDDYLYCGYQRNAETCFACGHIISDTILKAVGKSYHPKCFRCCICNECLDGFPFTVDPNKHIYCISDYHLVYAPQCAACANLILPPEGSEEITRVFALNKEFHIDCYRCEDCKIRLSDESEKRCYPIYDTESSDSPEYQDIHLYCLSCHLARIGATPTAGQKAYGSMSLDRRTRSLTPQSLRSNRSPQLNVVEPRKQTGRPTFLSSYIGSDGGVHRS